MYFIIHSPSSTAVERVEYANLHARVAELTGRPGLLRIPSVQRSMRERDRVYLAADRGAPGRALYGRGFILQRVIEDGETAGENA